MSPECLKCGNHVTPRFAKVFSVDGKVRGCTDCTDHSDLIEVQKEDDDGRPGFR